MVNLRNIFVNKNMLIISAILFFILIFSFYFYSTLPVGGYYNTDDLETGSAAIFAGKYGNWVFKDDFNSKFQTYGFIPPGYLISKDKLLFPYGFVGRKLLFIPFSNFLLEYSANLWQTFFGILCIILVFLIGKILFKNNIFSLFLSALFGLSAFFTAEINYFFPEVTGLFFLLFSIYYLLKFKDSNDTKWIFFAYVFFGISLLIRLTNILLLPTIIFLSYYKEQTNLKKRLKYFLIIGLIIFSIFLPQLIINKVTLGSFSEFSYTSYTNPYNNLLIKESEDISKNITSGEISPFFYRVINEYLFQKKSFGDYFSNLILLVKTLFIGSPIFLFFPLGLLYFLKKKRLNSFLYGSILLFILSFFVFGSIGGYFGEGSINIRSSLIRYLFLPICLFFIISFGGLLFLIDKVKSKKTKYLTVTLMIILVVLSNNPLIYPFNTYLRMDDKPSFKDSLTTTGNYVLTHTENNSIILSGGFDDGFLAGNREVFEYTFIPIDSRSQEIKRVVDKLIKENYKVYVYRLRGSSSVWGNDHLFNFTNLNYSISNLDLPDQRYELFKLN